MTRALEGRFFADELNGYVRELLLAEISRRTSGRAEFSFNVFDVLIDVDAGAVTLTDVLQADVEVTVALDSFAVRLRHGDPLPGDGSVNAESRSIDEDG